MSRKKKPRDTWALQPGRLDQAHAFAAHHAATEPDGLPEDAYGVLRAALGFRDEIFIVTTPEPNLELYHDGLDLAYAARNLRGNRVVDRLLTIEHKLRRLLSGDGAALTDIQRLALDDLIQLCQTNKIAWIRLMGVPAAYEKLVYEYVRTNAGIYVKYPKPK